MKGLIAVLAVLVVVGLAFFLYRTPTPPPEMTEAERAQIQAEVMGLSDAWLGIMSEPEGVNCDAGLDLLHPDRTAQLYQGELLNRAEWHDMCVMATGNIARVTMTWTKRDVQVLARDAAAFSGSYSSTWEYLDGSPARHIATSSQIGVAERTPGGWVWTIQAWSDGPSEVVEEG
jgi:hypothetical protein